MTYNNSQDEYKTANLLELQYICFKTNYYHTYPTTYFFDFWCIISYYHNNHLLFVINLQGYQK